MIDRGDTFAAVDICHVAVEKECICVEIASIYLRGFGYAKRDQMRKQNTDESEKSVLPVPFKRRVPFKRATPLACAFRRSLSLGRFAETRSLATSSLLLRFPLLFATPSMPSRRTRTGCLTCRQRRVKCDETYPRCRRCSRANRECRRGLLVKFVHGVRLTRESFEDPWSGTADYSFDPSQPWPDIETRQLAFIDESRSIASEYLGSSPEEAASLSLQAQLREPSQTHHADQRRPSTSLLSDVTAELVSTQLHSSLLQDELTHPSCTGDGPKFVDADEAFVFRHYVLHLGPSLDVCDQNRQFSTAVPELAMSSALVFNAVMAAAAHHRHYTNGSQLNTAELYHARCIELLIPLLSDAPPIQNEVIVSIVLLRFYEQMASAVTGLDSGRHLTGASAFMNSGSYLLAQNLILSAAFWLFLRQDIDIAINEQRCLTLKLEDISGVDVTQEPSNDWEWANRVVWLTAQATNYLFGLDKVHVTFEKIQQQIEDWQDHKPSSFRPLYVVRHNLFHEHYFTHPWHALAMQYYHTAKILLLLSDHQYAQIGVGNRQRRQSLQLKVLDHATQLFGISSSGDDMQARLGACHVVSLVAPFILDELQRCELISLLRRLEQRHAWPTRAIALSAMHEWDWDAEQQLQQWQSAIVGEV